MDTIPQQVCILAGGLGTRLRSTLPDLPKVLAPAAGRPFLEILVGHLCRQGCRRFVFLLGYKHQAVQACLDERIAPRWPDAELTTSVEPEPLGTGGAIKFAEAMLDGTVFLINGDSYLEFDPRALLDVHARHRAVATIAVREVPDTSRYGSVDVAENGRLTGFREKDTSTGRGLINAGAYVLEPSVIEAIPPGRAVSIERETFPQLLADGAVVMTCRQDQGRFIDIGTPESYRQFQDMDL